MVLAALPSGYIVSVSLRPVVSAGEDGYHCEPLGLSWTPMVQLVAGSAAASLAFSCASIPMIVAPEGMPKFHWRQDCCEPLVVVLVVNVVPSGVALLLMLAGEVQVTVVSTAAGGSKPVSVVVVPVKVALRTAPKLP